MRLRVAELDRTLAAQRKLSVDDKGASAAIAKLQVQASRLQDPLGKENIDSRGAARLEASLLGLEATAKRTQDTLGKLGSGPGFFSRTSTWGGLGRTLAGLLPGVSGAAGGAAAGGGQAAGPAAA